MAATNLTSKEQKFGFGQVIKVTFISKLGAAGSKRCRQESAFDKEVLPLSLCTLHKHYITLEQNFQSFLFLLEEGVVALMQLPKFRYCFGALILRTGKVQRG